MFKLLFLPFTYLKELPKRLFKFLLFFDLFRKIIIYPKLGIKWDSSLKRTITRPILHSEIDGGKYHFPVFANQTRVDDLRASRLRENDVLVVTYPKSGTHLCGYIVKLLAEKRTKIMQDKMILPFYEMLPQGVLDKCPADTQRFLKTHLPLELIPPCVTSTTRNKMVMCLRDPKDACISYYKFTLGLDILTGPVYESLDDWIELWLDGCVDYGDWCDLVLPYWEIRNQPNILIVTYEEILKEPGEVIREIAEFLGYTTSVEEVEEIKEKIQFDNMKKELLKTGAPGSTQMMREGKTGGHKGSFTPRHHVLFNRKFREKMAGTGFDLYTF